MLVSLFMFKNSLIFIRLFQYFLKSTVTMLGKIKSIVFKFYMFILKNTIFDSRIFNSICLKLENF